MSSVEENVIHVDDQGPLIVNEASEDGQDQSLMEEVLFSSSGADEITEQSPGTSWLGASVLIVNAALGT